MSNSTDAKVLEIASRKLKEAHTILMQNGYDDWAEALTLIKTEIDEEAKAIVK